MKRLLLSTILLAIAGTAYADIQAPPASEYTATRKLGRALSTVLFAVDELTGIVSACALMRPTGLTDLEVKSLKKKFKDKGFAAKCNREVIQHGCDMLGMELTDVMALTIKGMQTVTDELGLGAK